MKAIVQEAYGSPDLLKLKEIDMPVVEDDDVLVRVRAATVHAGDYFVMKGEPFAARALDDRVALAGITTLASLASLLPERDPHTVLFDLAALQQ